MSDEGFGTPRRDGDQLALRYERRYEATPDEVWSAVTDPDSIKRWLFADSVIEPRVGGAFRLTWDEDHTTGSVLAWEPPKLLEVEWLESDLQSILRIEISAVEDGTLLVLDHRKLTTEPALRVGPGWHAHLDTLGTVLAGRPESVEAWRDHYEALRPRYAQLVADTNPTP
jgi:uncharacterized protein YndB with AHSA1/START domain